MRTLVTIAVASAMSCGEEQSAYVKMVADHRAEIHREFRNPETSPLTEEDLKTFSGLNFFPIDSSYRVKAVLERKPGTDTFEMPATGEKTRGYVTFGIAHFELSGMKQQLSLYRMVNTDDDYMFIPFKDLTCGEESYGGGRFLDMTSTQGDSITVDFNLAYNPYCAYNDKYSCPIPPVENHLSIRIKAGEKNFGDH